MLEKKKKNALLGAENKNILKEKQLQECYIMCSNILKYAALFFTSRYNNACINAAQEILSILL